MQTTTLHSSEVRQSASAVQYPPLDQVTRPHVPTDQAAYYLTRRPQTLRGWASSGSGPVRPHKVNGRLAWPVATIRALLEV